MAPGLPLERPNSVRFDPSINLTSGCIFVVHEGVNIDFRTEGFNVLNQTNYDFPQSNVSSSSSFGVVVAARPPSLILQFAGSIIYGSCLR